MVDREKKVLPVDDPVDAFHLIYDELSRPPLVSVLINANI